MLCSCLNEGRRPWCSCVPRIAAAVFSIGYEAGQGKTTIVTICESSMVVSRIYCGVLWVVGSALVGTLPPSLSSYLYFD